MENIKSEKISLDNLFKSYSCLTLLVPLLGYEKVLELVKKYQEGNYKNIKEFLLQKFDRDFVEKVFSKEYILSLGFDEDMFFEK